MSYQTFTGHEELGRIWTPRTSLSLPGQAVRRKPVDLVVATVRRPLWSVKKALALPEVLHPRPDGAAVLRRLLASLGGQLDPALFRTEMIWHSVTHNERVNDGGGHNCNRCFGTVGASNGVGSAVAIASAALTITATDSSLEADAQGATTSEFTTIGLARAAGTVQNYVAASALDGVYAVDVYKSFSATGTGTAYGCGLFDQLVVAGSILLCEANFGTQADCVNGDTLNCTITYQN